MWWLWWFPALALSAVDKFYASYQLDINMHINGKVEDVRLFGSQLQFAVKRYLNNNGPPPLDQAWMIVSLPPEMQYTISQECPGLLAASHLLAAISTMYTNPMRAVELAAVATDYANIMPAVHLRGWDYETLMARYDETRISASNKLSTGEQPSVGVVVSHCDEDLSWY